MNYLKGDARKASECKFKPQYSFNDLVKDMIASDLKLAKLEKINLMSNSVSFLTIGLIILVFNFCLINLI